MCGSKDEQQKKNWAGNKAQWNRSMGRGNQLNRGPRSVSLEFVGAGKYSWGPSEWLVGRGLPDERQDGRPFNNAG